MKFLISHLCAVHLHRMGFQLLCFSDLLMHSLWHLGRSKHFWRCYGLCYSKDGVQTKSVTCNFYRAFTSQGNSKICWCIMKLLTPFPVRQGNSAKEICNHPGLLVLTNINNSIYWRGNRFLIFFVQSQMYLQTLTGWLRLSWKQSNVSINSSMST